MDFLPTAGQNQDYEAVEHGWIENYFDNYLFYLILIENYEPRTKFDVTSILTVLTTSEYIHIPFPQ